jgi:hypothetical protein
MVYIRYTIHFFKDIINKAQRPLLIVALQAKCWLLDMVFLQLYIEIT